MHESRRPLIIRILTSNALIGLVAMVVLGVVAFNLNFGGTSGPPALAEDGPISANEALQLIQQPDIGPIEANAIANAKRRAYERQKAIEKKAREKRAWYRKHKKEIDAKKEAERIAKLPNPSSEENKKLGKQLSDLRGWSSCWKSLETLWTHESHWNERADNPWSDAYGIPQALPGTKMATAGPNWQYNATTQIVWGLGYIKSRYGDPCKAWGFWQSHNWY
ncbi:lytic transglycosylase domain-containing protein [Actinocorallia longicatena]|uniref:Transglycosylase-like protein with SLT domain n=1 Tax=Actinocorallia longicatena TaxID=111803 RepID=A0ABP6QM60_9ACTN